MKRRNENRFLPTKKLQKKKCVSGKENVKNQHTNPNIIIATDLLLDAKDEFSYENYYRIENRIYGIVGVCLECEKYNSRKEYILTNNSKLCLLKYVESCHFLILHTKFKLIVNEKDILAKGQTVFDNLSIDINVNQRSLETTGLELCGGGGGGAAATGVPQGQSSSAGSIGSAPSPASPRPAPQHRPPLTTSSQSSRNLDDDRSTDAVGPNAATDDSDDSESRAQYVSANCVVFTHYRGDAATEVEEHFQRALAQDKPKDNNNPMITRNFPASFWKSHHEVYEYTDPWHSHYTQYHPRAVHEYHHHHHNMAAASYNSLLLNRSLGHPTSHPGVPHHAHTAATYKDWTSATPSQSLVDASSAPPYPHGPYAPLSSDYWT